jgi:branched-chain amino acid transport system ATP-binding protein
VRPAALSLDAVDAGYGPFRALRSVSLDIHADEAVAVLGPNGAGKTTLARVASGLVEPTGGRVLIDGVVATSAPVHRFARLGVAHAPEGRSVFATFTVEENLALPFHRLFGRQGVGPGLERAYDLFPRLGERRSQLAGTLSGGEQRMLSMARVLVEEPRVLIADELSFGLAPIIIDEVYETLAAIRRTGTSMLIIEQHVAHALDLCDRVVLMDQGRVRWRGAPEQAASRAVDQLFDAGSGQSGFSAGSAPEGSP